MSDPRLVELIDARFAEQVEFLRALVRMPSDNPPGDCAPHAALTATMLETLGFSVQRLTVADADARAHGMRSVTNLKVCRRFGTGPTIALNAHGDVVPPGEGWTRPPYAAEVVDGVMYGRGVAVSKSDIATYAFALAALETSGLPLQGTVELHITYDEETGGLLGPGWLLDQGLSRPDMVISAGFSYQVVVAHNGCLHLEVRVEGRSAHAARPETGVDALHAAVHLLNGLYALRDEYRQRHSSVAGIEHPTLVVGLINGGINTNVVPDVVTLRIDRRIIPEESADTVEDELTQWLLRQGAALPGIRVHVQRVLLARPLTPMPGQRALVRSLQHHARAIFGSDIPTTGVPIYTDARLYAEHGIPTVLYGAGPRSLLEANGHRADEKLVLADLRRATQVVALAIADLLRPAGAGIMHGIES